LEFEYIRVYLKIGGCQGKIVSLLSCLVPRSTVCVSPAWKCCARAKAFARPEYFYRKDSMPAKAF